MKKILIIIPTIVLLNIFMVNFSYVVAAVPGEGASSPPAKDSASSPPANNSFSVLTNPIKATNIKELLISAVDLAIAIGVIIAVIMFIFIGFKFVLAQGDPGKLKEARSWFLYAVIGTAILISSKVIVDVVRDTLISAGVVNEKLFK